MPDVKEPQYFGDDLVFKRHPRVAGLEYRFWQRWAVRYEWTRLDNIENEDGIDVRGLALDYAW